MECKGTYTAIVTPLKNDEVDYEGLRNNILFQIEQGVDGIVPLGTTGETPTLSEQEQEQIIKVAVETVRENRERNREDKTEIKTERKVKVIVGTGSNSTKHTIEKTQRAKELGADAVLIVTPYYNKPTQEGIFQHFKAITEAVDIPVVVYNIQGRTGTNIETGTLQRIAKLHGIIGVKEASGNLTQMMEVIRTIQNTSYGQFSVLSGDDALTVPLIAIGGMGVVSVVSNIVPGKIVAMVQAARDGNFAEARRMHYELLPLFQVAFIETNPIPIKEAMMMCGMAAGSCRLPLCEMKQENKEKLRSVLEQMKLIK